MTPHPRDFSELHELPMVEGMHGLLPIKEDGDWIVVSWVQDGRLHHGLKLPGLIANQYKPMASQKAQQERTE